MELLGKLIAVEGVDGSGKSTQLYLLKRWLELRKLNLSSSKGRLATGRSTLFMAAQEMGMGSDL